MVLRKHLQLKLVFGPHRQINEKSRWEIALIYYIYYFNSYIDMLAIKPQYYTSTDIELNTFSEPNNESYTIESMLVHS